MRDRRGGERRRRSEREEEREGKRQRGRGGGERRTKSEDKRDWQTEYVTKEKGRKGERAGENQKQTTAYRQKQIDEWREMIMMM